jgi:L-ribulokinase
VIGVKYAIGIDFGTESGRAVLVNLQNGEEIAASVHRYANGVIDERLPGSEFRLAPDWALQDPNDYLEVCKRTIPAVLEDSGVNPADVIGIGIDFTACTLLPVKANGTPLCFLPQWRAEPHAWVKLWKHHAAQPEADRINEIAREKGFAYLDRYGGKISSEWLLPKVWQTLDEAPDVFAAADGFIEAADWVIWQLTGVETRSSCAAGYKAIWSKRDGYPTRDFLKNLDPRLEHLVDKKLTGEVTPIGNKAGSLTAQAASWTGLEPGTAVAVANVDAHVSVPAASVVEPGRMVIIMGTSNCHMVLSNQEATVPGICGCVEDGIIPGLFGYEAGQPCVGDQFAWFVENCVPASYQQEAANLGIDMHALLEQKAARLKPGESGLVALDWWNGNRSVLVDGGLSGMILGMTLLTKPEEIYLALIEATAFGTRVIIENFNSHGIQVDEIIATGGLPDRNRLFMQVYADVTGMEVKVVASRHTSALGAAMFAGVAAGKAAGGYDNIVDASHAMSRLRDETYRPNAAAQAVYDPLFAEYRRLYDYFGRGENDVMKRLKSIKSGALRSH